MLLALQFFIKRSKEQRFGGYQVSMVIDALLIMMAFPYVVLYLGSFFVVDETYFFEHMETLLLVYLTTVISSFMSKGEFMRRFFELVSMGFLLFLILFPLLSSGIAIVVSGLVMISYLISGRYINTNFITGAVVTYWLLLITVSSMDYNIISALAEGFSATIIETFVIYWNAASFGIYEKSFSGLGGILVLVAGYLFSLLMDWKKKEKPVSKEVERILNLPKKTPSEAGVKKFTFKAVTNNDEAASNVKGYNEIKEENKKILEEELKGFAEKTKAKPEQQKNTVRSKDNSSDEEVKELEGLSKKFFSISSPHTMGKIDRYIEKKLRDFIK